MDTIRDDILLILGMITTMVALELWRTFVLFDHGRGNILAEAAGAVRPPLETRDIQEEKGEKKRGGG